MTLYHHKRAQNRLNKLVFAWWSLPKHGEPTNKPNRGKECLHFGQERNTFFVTKMRPNFDLLNRVANFENRSGILSLNGDLRLKIKSLNS